MNPAAERRTAAWPAPLRLLAGLLGPRGAAGISLDAPQWAEFARLVVERHRVAPQALAAIAETGLAVPEPALRLIADEARRNALEALRQKAETARLIGALGARGCRPMVLKGWPLAEELTGSAAGRHAKDIDVYVDPAEIESCCAALAELGYRPLPEHRGRLRLMGRGALAAECNDIAFERPDGLQVELHWRTSHFRGWPDLRDLAAGARKWPLDATGIGVRVPEAAANLIYLALHGQQHAWLRLKWLHDVALALRRKPEAAETALELAARAGAARALVAAADLAGQVFGDPLPPGWPRPDRMGRAMTARFLEGIAADAAAPGTPRARFDFYWVGLAMGQGLAQRAGVLRYAFWRGPRLFLAGLGRG